MAGYTHLSYQDRIKLEALLKAGHRKTDIARQIGCSRSTLYRELERGRYMHTNHDLTESVRYSADKGQNDYNEKAQAKGPQLKIGNDYAFVEHVEDMIINHKFSPDVIVGRIKQQGLHFAGMVSARTLYNYIDMGYIFPNVTSKSLWMKGQRKRKHDKVVKARTVKPLLRSIEQRPKEIRKRTESGHWEMDTVIGKAAGKNEVLLVLTERYSRYEIIRKIEGKTQAAVVKALDDLEYDLGSEFSSLFRTLTIDNGCEFLDADGIERSIFGVGKRTTAYYCHPYASSERGSNENANKIIRRFIPKGDDINKYSHEFVAQVQSWMNNYPRRILGYKTPAEVLGVAIA